ncbi:hypothetical protein HanPI659440_Chr09g0347451 [Helianthus annuus]|nr:hypothetical protein HanPI659440_Chr09g0347451 [Helianthus annuus]
MGHFFFVNGLCGIRILTRLYIHSQNFILGKFKNLIFSYFSFYNYLKQSFQFLFSACYNVYGFRNCMIG